MSYTCFDYKQTANPVKQLQHELKVMEFKNKNYALNSKLSFYLKYYQKCNSFFHLFLFAVKRNKSTFKGVVNDFKKLDIFVNLY